MSRLPVTYLTHGGGPWNEMEDSMSDPAYQSLSTWLLEFGRDLSEKARSLLVISAHWEEARPTLHYGEAPSMLYDYGGFPEHTYHLQWPAPGSPSLASRADELLKSAGFSTGRETRRGYDHGTFVPMMVAFPDARLPVAQLSLVKGLDALTHWNIGKALAPLRDEGVAIIGSGMSYHNLRALISGDPAIGRISASFNQWLVNSATLVDPGLRREALVHWMTAPGALESHPRSEHLTPLFAIAGAASDERGHESWHARLLGAEVSCITYGA